MAIFRTVSEITVHCMSYNLRFRVLILHGFVAVFFQNMTRSMTQKEGGFIHPQRSYLINTFPFSSLAQSQPEGICIQTAPVAIG